MKNALRNYRTSLKKLLFCRRSTRRRLLAQFDQMSVSFLEDNPSPSQAELTEAFGAPKVLAEQLMEEVSEQEQRHFRRRRYLVRMIAAVAALVLIGYSVWLNHAAIHPISVTETIIIYEEVPQ